MFQSCPILCDRMDCSPPGSSSIHGILQKEYCRVLPWPPLQGLFPAQSLNPRLLCLLHWQEGSLPPAPLGKSLVNVNLITPQSFNWGDKAFPVSWPQRLHHALEAGRGPRTICSRMRTWSWLLHLSVAEIIFSLPKNVLCTRRFHLHPSNNFHLVREWIWNMISCFSGVVATFFP